MERFSGLSAIQLERALLGLVLEVDRAKGAREVTRAFLRFVELAGFDSVFALRVPTAAAAAAVAGEADVLMTSRSTEWLTRYLSGGLLVCDPMLREARTRLRAVSWADVRRRLRPGSEGRAVLALAAEFGMDSGLTVPVFEASGAVGFVDVAGRGVVVDDVLRASVTAASLHTYGRLAALTSKRAASATVALTTREIEVLRWIANGKSDWQIGKILPISAKTVNYHAENVKQKFDVSTRIQAVVAAIRCGALAG
jgi:LuxR family quorum sensing-dependent transcriptional regulator